jgi:hypothetical protein
MANGRVRIWVTCITTAYLLVAALPSAGEQPPDNVEQLFIYELNRARNNPARFDQQNSLAADLSGVAPQPPLAVNNNLVHSASFHAEEMATFNYFGHTSAVTGDQPNKMALDHGYPLPFFYPEEANNIESIAAGTAQDTALEPLVLLIEDVGVDPPGHRIHLLAMDPFFADHREIGVGHAFNMAAQFDHYWAIHTGVRDDSVAAPQFLTGVVFSDANGNRRYDLGEGLGAVTVSNGTASVQTNGAGGWSMFVAPGIYTVTASGGGLLGAPSARVTVASSVNVEVDFISGYPIGEVNFARQTGPGILSIACPAASLQDAINAALPGETINVTGTCSENILVRNEKQRITINGGGNATIQAPSNSSAAVNIRGKGILMQGFTIRGGNGGVAVNRGSNAVLHNNIIELTGGNGVTIEQMAFAVLTNNTIQNNPGAGVLVQEASTARIGFNADNDAVASANTIQNNVLGGLIVANGSSARIIGNTISGNMGDGVLVMRDAQADLASNVLSTNNGNGIQVGENSFVQLGEDSGGTIFELANSGNGNAGFGIMCVDGGAADGRAGTLAGISGATSFDSTCTTELLP